jgi:hypothetical protein
METCCRKMLAFTVSSLAHTGLAVPRAPPRSVEGSMADLGSEIDDSSSTKSSEMSLGTGYSTTLAKRTWTTSRKPKEAASLSR